MEPTRTPLVTTASTSSPSKRRLSFSLIDSIPSRSASPSLSASAAAANHRSYATSTTPATASAMLGRRPLRILRRCERWCCGCLTCIPLAFVYGLTTWAVWVEVDLGLSVSESRWVGRFTSLLGFTLYVLLNVCYTFAVFTDPGSPLGNTSSTSSAYDYSHLPTTETAAYNPLTVSSTGEPRYCRKCQLPKPDRAHHCSTCNRCILKMDHHCPWLATCVGFRNYKSFLLFLIYVSIFCWVCLAVTMNIIVVDVFSLADPADTTVGIGCFILAVLAGVLGLVLTGFTAWHISLVSRNLTTIESLERTRYVMSLRDILDHKRKEVLMAWNQGQLAPPMNIQKRQEAQEEARSRGQYDQWQKDSNSGRFSHTVNPYQRASYAPEHLHELERHYMYLDDSEAEALPHAFDRGWRENFRLLFGDSRLWWFLPTKSVSGDGWVWPINPKFANARRKLEQKRQQRIHDVVEGWRCFYWAQSPTGPSTPTASSGSGSGSGSGPGLVAQAGAWPRPKNPYAIAAARQAEEEMRIDMEAMRHGNDGDEEQGGAGVSMKTLDFDRMGVQRGN